MGQYRFFLGPNQDSNNLSAISHAPEFNLGALLWAFGIISSGIFSGIN